LLSRKLYVGLGHVSVALGVAGVFLPVMPTVVFMIVAAWCYARGNPALRGRLLAHPSFGPPIRDWEEHRAISLRGKVLGIATIVGGFTISLLWFVKLTWLRIVLAALGAALVGFLLAVKTSRRR
jgi:uncharacterized membrane protein YbaN (DUF454 family)